MCSQAFLNMVMISFLLLFLVDCRLDRICENIFMCSGRLTRVVVALVGNPNLCFYRRKMGWAKILNKGTKRMCKLNKKRRIRGVGKEVGKQLH